VYTLLFFLHRSLQIIETIRQEKLTLSEKAEAFENLCTKMTKELEIACNEIIIVKQECYSWKSRAAAKEDLLEEEKVETKALRDMMYKKDEQIESYTVRISGQDGDIDTMKRAISTKDRQLVLLVKERDRYKQELKSISNQKPTDSGRYRTERNLEFDTSLTSLSIMESPSVPGSPSFRSVPGSPSFRSSPSAALRSPGSERGGRGSGPSSPSPAGLSLEVNRSFSKSLETSEREYKAIIRKLRADLDAANAIINSKKGPNDSSRRR
jgi:hypothetical protein